MLWWSGVPDGGLCLNSAQRVPAILRGVSEVRLVAVLLGCILEGDIQKFPSILHSRWNIYEKHFHQKWGLGRVSQKILSLWRRHAIHIMLGRPWLAMAAVLNSFPRHGIPPSSRLGKSWISGGTSNTPQFTFKPCSHPSSIDPQLYSQGSLTR